MDKTQITAQAKRLAGGVVDPATFRPSRPTLIADALAGLTFALVNIPQSMGHALLANVNPIQGLFTLVIGMPVAALFTSSVFMNVSTTSALAVAVGEPLRNVPASEQAVFLTTLILLAGLFQFGAGLLRLGALMRFISNSVMLGFTTGVAILIILGQTQDITGYDSAYSNKVLILADIILHLGQIDWPTLLVGLLTLALILGFGYTPLRRFAPIAGMAVITFLVWLVQPASVSLVGETIPEGGAALGVTLPSLALIPVLIPTAFAVAIIGLVQGAGVSQSYANPDGKYPNSSRDFWGQGLANLAVSFFRGIPAGGSMSGTGLMVTSGARSRLANIFGGLLVAPIALILGGVISLIPLSALAGPAHLDRLSKPEARSHPRGLANGLLPACGLRYHVDHHPHPAPPIRRLHWHRGLGHALRLPRLQPDPARVLGASSRRLPDRASAAGHVAQPRRDPPLSLWQPLFRRCAALGEATARSRRL